MKKFAINFGVSFLGYLAAIFLALLLLQILSRSGVPFVGGPFPIWVEIILWLHFLMVAAWFFFLGTKLNLLGTHWLNFLSVCGILLVGLLLTFFGTYLGVFVHFVFFRLGPFLAGFTDNLYVGLSILSVLPSVLIWLGMLYKSKRA